jgi:alcohol dehydrogenase
LLIKIVIFIAVMNGLIFHKFRGPLSVEKVPDPIHDEFGVVVKVLATGMCRSDWHGWMGHDQDIILPHIPGHEWAGTIAAVGNRVKKFSVGDRVTAPFVCGCGSCEQCHSGNEQVCDNQSQPGFTHWGSFATYVRIDQADTNLVKLPEEIDNITASILGCRFITSYRAVVEQGKVKPEQYVAVHGCGGVGLSAIMIAKAMGAHVIAVDINDSTLALARELGATFTVNPTQNNLIDTILDYSKGGVNVSIDGLGSYETCVNSISSLRKRGKHIQVGLMTTDHTHPKVPMDRVLAEELEIIGSHGMQAHKYPEMLEMIIDGRLQPQKLIERTISLNEAASLLPKMNEFSHSGVQVIDSF